MPRRTALARFMLCALATAPAVAHHSIAHDFDVSRPLRLEGRVVHFAWRNPHCAIRLAVLRPDGAIDLWDVEGGPPNALRRRGWTKETVQEGARIVVNGHAARDGSRRANAQQIELVGGRLLDAGSSYLPARP